MKHGLVTSALAIGLTMAPGRVSAQASASADSSFRAFLPTWEKAVIRMLNGDTTAYLTNASHRDDVTLMTPYGGVVVGWAEVSQRYRIAADRMEPNSGATARFDYLAMDVDGDLAYIVLLECSDFMFKGDSAMRKGSTRVTEAFRRESGQWKMMHRHMDHLPEQMATPEPGGKHC